ncbi:hypothetical protein [Flavilitoribacter nigricans]|uniref:Uncharacterized protein n=1 Tax=Flavilitoribacter nigricans (strain ATCC 23147 / DSM 23189 / NBRC 102662 / NCIMB 1420 / SS-2) TaxID=1122177 RepID=A0A2D0NF15_FLAN2|nr:hypothetical protein [Flavilitoribacter nigricans]PHN06769.1 hypothetical protein CRP01_10785 [Flavilitoribacter nigricans DSM 23189 = NBRC 102662]
MEEQTPPNPDPIQTLSGRIRILPENGEGAHAATLILEGDTGRIIFKGILIDGNTADLNIGAEGRAGDLRLLNSEGNTTVHLDGQAGDIILSNADFAEDFDIDGTVVDRITPGTVMVLDQRGRLQESKEPYDKKVAGVISGAGPYRPGIVMDKQADREHRLPVALVGKVYCRVDADYGAIEVGDLLTTSARPGHAMKATDPVRAFGAVMGKALRPLDKGQGMIPILVSLQ